jgi:hypothetical protein
MEDRLTDEKKNEATEAEKRAHVLGLVKETARATAMLMHAVAYLVEKVPTEDIDPLGLHHRADNLRRLVDDLDAGVYRGRVNDNVRTAPGALVRRAESMADLGAALAELPDDKAVEVLNAGKPQPRAEWEADLLAVAEANNRKALYAEAARQQKAFGASSAFVEHGARPTPSTPRPKVLTAPTPADYDAQGKAPPAASLLRGFDSVDHDGTPMCTECSANEADGHVDTCARRKR